MFDPADKETEPTQDRGDRQANCSGLVPLGENRFRALAEMPIDEPTEPCSAGKARSFQTTTASPSRNVPY